MFTILGLSNRVGVVNNVAFVYGRVGGACSQLLDCHVGSGCVDVFAFISGLKYAIL